MKPIILITIIACSFFLISCSKKVKETPLDQYKVSVIHDNWDSTKSLANSNNKNICLMIHASWCSICNTFKSEVLTDQSVENELANNIIMSLIDGDKDYGKPIYNQYGASGFPTFVITDANGNMLTKRSGKINKEEFINWIKPYYK